MFLKLFGALLILVGIGASVWSLTVQAISGQQVATLAVAAFLFAGVVGIWSIHDMIEDYLKNK